MVILIAVSALLGASFASLSNALALVVRQRESLIGAVTTVVLPLTFLSTAFMQAGRSAAAQHTDWGLVGTRAAYLVALLVVSAWLATRSFRAYQRSI